MRLRNNWKRFSYTYLGLVILALHGDILWCRATEYLDTTTLLYLDAQPQDLSMFCFDHMECPSGAFCSSAGYLYDWLPFGECLPCSECFCNNVSIDSVCPVSRCPLGETHGIIFMQGTLYSSHEVVGGDVCLSIWVFEGHSFRQLSFYVERSLYETLVRDGSIDAADQGFLDAETQCAEVHGGVKSGVFDVNSNNDILFTYTYGYDYYQNASIMMSGKLYNSCPNIDLVLDRSSIPLFIPIVNAWRPSQAAMNAYDFVSDPRLSCAKAAGFCLQTSNEDSRTSISLRLRRFADSRGQGDAIIVFQTSLANNAWLKDINSDFQYLSSASLCSMIIEQSNLNYGLLYFRTQVYGCSPKEPSVILSTPAPTMTSTTKSYKATTYSSQLMTTIPIPTSAATTFLSSSAATAPNTTSGPCQRFGDLLLHFGSSNESASILNCSSGSIDLTNYPLGVSTFWRINIAGPITLTFSEAIGFVPIKDYISILPANAPQTYLTGHSSDPSSTAGIYVCLDLSSCVDGGRVFEMLGYGQVFQGPLMIHFVSNSLLSTGGAVLNYQANSPGRRLLDRISVPNPPISTRSFRRANPVACQCSDFPVDGCPSIFFQSSACEPALSFAPWLAYHTPSVIDLPSNKTQTVDAVLYLERFVASKGGDGIFVTATFDIFTPNLAHPLDVISLFRGDDGDNGSCDEFRTLSSCTTSSPLLNVPTLTKQLCWAYTSSLSDVWSDQHTPAPDVGLSSGTVNFCDELAQNAGVGTYYIVLYSYRLKQIIAEIDYVQGRDCGGAKFPCSPGFGSPQGVQYDFTGPLAVCLPSYFRNSLHVCQSCSKGTYSRNLNSLSCFSCPPNQYSTPPYVNCTACPAKPDDSIRALCNISSISLNVSINGTARFQVTTPAPIIVGTTAPAIRCGDGIVTASQSGGVYEQCDDGPQSYYVSLNQSQALTVYQAIPPTRVQLDVELNDKMCDYSTCTLSTLYCSDGIVTSYRPVYVLSACTHILDITVCPKSAQMTVGNKLVVYNEECDDGNLRSGDGCNAQCQIEPLYECAYNGGTVCHKTCPNGLLNNDGEQCDDGNLVNGDGCSSTCQIECGFACEEAFPGATSICRPVCGDGIIAVLEQCDTALVMPTSLNPLAAGCNRFCQIERGWECITPPSVCVTGVVQNTTCSPICGDGFIVSPEECDDGQWNLDDKACLSTCRINFGEVCYGPPCLSPTPVLRRSPSALLTTLQSGVTGVADGVIVVRDAFNATYGSLSRSFGFWPQRYSSNANSFPALVVSTPSTKAAAIDISQSATAAFCVNVPHTVWQATSGRIIEDLKFVANNISCNYSIAPSPQGKELEFNMIRLDIINISLKHPASIMLTQSTPFTNSTVPRQCKLSAPYNVQNITGPIYLLAPIEIKISADSIGTSLESSALSMNIQFTTLSPPQVTIDESFCSFSCGCDFHCSSLCFERGLRMLHEQNMHQTYAVLKDDLTRSLAQDDPGFEDKYPIASKDRNQLIAMMYDSGPLEMSSASFPTSFTQSPTTWLMLSPQRIEAVTSREFEGSWQGTCDVELSESDSCSVLVQIANDTIVKHTWGCPFRGYAIGRFVQVDTSFRSVLDSQTQPCYYLYGQIIWTTSTSPGDALGTPTQCLLNIGENYQVASDLQILFAGGVRTLLGNPAFYAGGQLLPESNCKLLTLEKLSPPQLGYEPSGDAKGQDEESYLNCNSSVSQSFSNLQSKSRECLILLKVLLLRDFWVPIDPNLLVLNSDFDWQPLSDFVCASPCLQDFLSEIQTAIRVCESAWKRQWWNWQVAFRQLKLLMSITSASFWPPLLCASNRNGKACSDLVGFPAAGCPGWLPQSLYMPQFVWSNHTCTPSCVANLSNYVDLLDCCASTIEQAGNNAMDILAHPYLRQLEIDFGDRSDPFNTTFPKVPDDLVQLYFNNTQGLQVSHSGDSIQAPLANFVVSAHFLFGQCGLSCEWPIKDQQCCDNLVCQNGNKSYRGACYCDCFPGYQGALCNQAGFFVDAKMTFPGFVFLDTFTYCNQIDFEKLVSQDMGISPDDISFQVISETQRRSTESFVILLRIVSTSCDDSKRSTQKLATLVQAVNHFQLANVPVPLLQSIWSFCDAAKTSCGDVSDDGKVDLTTLAASCITQAGAGPVNHTQGDGSASGGAVITSWEGGVFAIAGIAGAAMLVVPLFCFRRKIKRWIIAEGRKHQQRRRGKRAPALHGATTADIVFVHGGGRPKGAELVISSPAAVGHFELKFANHYLPLEADPAVRAQELAEAEKSLVEALHTMREKRRSSVVIRPAAIADLQSNQNLMIEGTASPAGRPGPGPAESSLNESQQLVEGLSSIAWDVTVGPASHRNSAVDAVDFKFADLSGTRSLGSGRSPAAAREGLGVSGLQLVEGVEGGTAGDDSEGNLKMRKSQSESWLVREVSHLQEPSPQPGEGIPGRRQSRPPAWGAFDDDRQVEQLRCGDAADSENGRCSDEVPVLRDDKWSLKNRFRVELGRRRASSHTSDLQL